MFVTLTKLEKYCYPMNSSSTGTGLIQDKSINVSMEENRELEEIDQFLRGDPGLSSEERKNSSELSSHSSEVSFHSSELLFRPSVGKIPSQPSYPQISPEARRVTVVRTHDLCVRPR